MANHQSPNDPCWPRNNDEQQLSMGVLHQVVQFTPPVDDTRPDFIDSSEVPTEEEEYHTTVPAESSGALPSSDIIGNDTSIPEAYYLTQPPVEPHPAESNVFSSDMIEDLERAGQGMLNETSDGESCHNLCSLHAMKRLNSGCKLDSLARWHRRLRYAIGEFDTHYIEYSNSALAGKSIFFGHKSSANVELVIGSKSEATKLHAHWEVICSSFAYFQNMKDSGMRESIEGVAYFPADSPRAWLTLLKRVYPPYKQLSFSSAVEIITLVDRLQSPWLSKELQKLLYQCVSAKLVCTRYGSNLMRKVLSDEAFSDQRTPAIADLLAAHGLGDVLASWFREKYWPSLNAWRCVSDCKDVKALRCAALYVCHEAASMKSQVEQLRKTLRDVKMESRGRQNRISRMKSAGEIFYS